MKPPTYELRTALPGDAGFLLDLIETTMRAHVERTWGAWSAERAERQVREAIAAGAYSILVCEGIEAGAVSILRGPTRLELSQLYLLPSHQRRGIGTSVIRTLVGEARAANKVVGLRVLAVNPARRLYEREGFQVVSTTPERVFLELRP